MERGYPTAAKYPAEIARLRQLVAEEQQARAPIIERQKAVQSLLKRFLSDQMPKGQHTWSEDDAARPAREGLLGMTKEQLMAEAKHLKIELAGMSKFHSTIMTEIERLFKLLPNVTSPETPIGKYPKVVGYINEHIPKSPSTSARSHALIGKELELIDFAIAGKTTGWGWYYLLNEAALLEQALIQYALSVARKAGWAVVSPPSIVYSDMASKCGFQPRDQNGEQQVYAIQQSSKDENKPERCLTGTAEIPLAAMLSHRVITAEDLPKRHVAVSRCYRAEAGARGVGSKGLYRVHEFTKVEMFAWTYPTEEASTAIFDEIHRIQVDILTSLGLHCRILEMPSTDLGASATRKRDIEAFFPSRSTDDGFGEVTSVSTCTDYQTAALSTSFEAFSARKVKEQTTIPESPHPFTVNGTALAVPRVLAAILENGWNEEKREVAIPQCLWPWMDGVEVISSKGTTPSDSMSAETVQDPIISMSDDISSESQEETTTTEESDLNNGNEEDSTSRIEGNEIIDSVSMVEEGDFSGEAQEEPAIIDTPTEEDSSSGERTDGDEIATAEEASEGSQVAEDISSIDTLTSETTQSTEEAQPVEPVQSENTPPNETQPTEESQPSEEVKDESATKSIFSRFLGR